VHTRLQDSTAQTQAVSEGRAAWDASCWVSLCQEKATLQTKKKLSCSSSALCSFSASILYKLKKLLPMELHRGLFAQLCWSDIRPLYTTSHCHLTGICSVLRHKLWREPQRHRGKSFQSYLLFAACRCYHDTRHLGKKRCKIKRTSHPLCCLRKSNLPSSCPLHEEINEQNNISVTNKFTFLLQYNFT